MYFLEISPRRGGISFFVQEMQVFFVCLLHNRMPTCFICNESIYLCINRNFYLHYLEQDLQAIAYKRKDEGKKDIAKAHYELVTAYVEFFKILIDDIAVQGD